jgi:hypothetical protein
MWSSLTLVTLLHLRCSAQRRRSPPYNPPNDLVYVATRPPAPYRDITVTEMVRAYAKWSRRIPSRRMPGWDRRAELPTRAANTERRTPRPRTPRSRRSGGAHRGGWGRGVPADLRRQRAHVAARAVGSAAPNRRAGHGMFGRISRERTWRPTRLSRRELLSSHPSLAFALHTFGCRFVRNIRHTRNMASPEVCRVELAVLLLRVWSRCGGADAAGGGADAAGQTPRGRRRGGRGGAHVAGRTRRGGAAGRRSARGGAAGRWIARGGAADAGSRGRAAGSRSARGGAADAAGRGAADAGGHGAGPRTLEGVGRGSGRRRTRRGGTRTLEGAGGLGLGPARDGVGG